MILKLAALLLVGSASIYFAPDVLGWVVARAAADPSGAVAITSIAVVVVILSVVVAGGLREWIRNAWRSRRAGGGATL